MKRILIAAVVLACMTGCTFKRRDVDSVPTLEYPAWASSLVNDATSLVASSAIRGTQGTLESMTIERMSLYRSAQGAVMRVRIDRPMQRHAIDVVYDSSSRPLRLWQRMDIMHARTPRHEVKLFELRVSPIAISYRDLDNVQTYERINREGQAVAVMTEALTSLTPWLRAAHLSEGAQVRGLVLDMEKGGVLQPALLQRLQDMERPAFGGRVRVYKLYGRDVFFANADDVVIGDLSGFVPLERTSEALPPEATEPTTVDPTELP